MPHLHLSLQSGSYNVLKKMARQYSTDDFRKTVALLKSRLDRPAITTDIIVGFPGETDADFEQTVNLAGEIGFAKMHVFAFSPRMGTTAANMKPQIGKATIKNRSNILRRLDAELQSQFRQQFIGETAEVLVENVTGRVCGRSERYFMVRLKGEHDNLKRNDLVTVKLVDNAPDSLIGELI
jgi:threonylcarbamoyladenosine tRNA methylthiotransferase MtaB